MGIKSMSSDMTVITSLFVDKDSEMLLCDPQGILEYNIKNTMKSGGQTDRRTSRRTLICVTASLGRWRKQTPPVADVPHIKY